MESQNFSWRQNCNDKAQKESCLDVKSKYPNILHSNRPSGGKRMDILKQNYKEIVSEDGDDSSMPMPDSITNQNSSKVIILSDELVETNMNHENTTLIPLTSTKIEHIKKDVKFNIATSSSDRGDLKVADLSETNTTIPPSMFIPISQLVMADSSSIAPMQTMGNIQNIRHTIISGKPSELIITNTHQNETFHTDAKIMNMPTIIMLNSFDAERGKIYFSIHIFDFD